MSEETNKEKVDFWIANKGFWIVDVTVLHVTIVSINRYLFSKHLFKSPIDSRKGKAIERKTVAISATATLAAKATQHAPGDERLITILLVPICFSPVSSRRRSIDPQS